MLSAYNTVLLTVLCQCHTAHLQTYSSGITDTLYPLISNFLIIPVPGNHHSFLLCL